MRKARVAWMLAVAFAAGFVCAGASAAEDIADSFQQANAAYRDGHFAQAAQMDETILQSGRESGAVYYNLGNAYFKSGRPGLALWAYLEALRLIPRDSDLRNNLRYVRDQLPEASGTVSVESAVGGLTAWISPREWAWAAAIFVWLASLLWAAVVWMPKPSRIARPAAGLAAALAALTFAALAFQTVAWDAPAKAVVVDDGAQALFAPQRSGTPHFPLPQGAIVQVVGQDGGWLQVRRPDGLTGWLASDQARQLR